MPTPELVGSSKDVV